MEHIVDREYCMSSYLMYRTIADRKKRFKEDIIPYFYEPATARVPISSADQLLTYLKETIERNTRDGKAALALSGGIDSGILARLMPRGSKAYTFRCVVPGQKVTDESDRAALYADENGLEHEIIDVYWEDYLRCTPEVMRHKGAPVHSIEIQIYMAAQKARRDGFERLIFGEAADAIYGGLDQLMSKNWRFGDFVERYTFLLPYRILKNAQLILQPYMKYENMGYIDIQQFMSEFFYRESVGSYDNACKCAGINFVGPYAETSMAEKWDKERIGSGDSKYYIREIHDRLYPGKVMAPKLPMPRAVNEWLKDWKGPVREEFWPDCIEGLTGDQKWLTWCLEQFLDMLDKEV